jgi:hypothetical protein
MGSGFSRRIHPQCPLFAPIAHLSLYLPPVLRVVCQINEPDRIAAPHVSVLDVATNVS